MLRLLAPWQNPSWLSASQWREVVRHQELAIICRDTIIMNILNTPWRVSPRELASGNEYEEEVKSYTELIRTTDGGFHHHMDLVLQDALDTPFGGAAEVGRENDDPEGAALWLKHIDSATLYPTFNDDYPVVQKVPSEPVDYVIFPKHAIARIGYTPRPEFLRKGWFMAPPEKVYLGLELLVRGDRYYANLLSDTPEAGILDLGDMEQASAETWLSSWKDLMNGIDPFKIPVLYEHTTPAQYIAFGRPPTELMFDKTTLKYASFVAAGYGLSLPDIGLVVEGTGASLAGQIRSERRSSRTGIGVTRLYVKAYWDSILPSYLQFEFVDRDDEILVSKGRARLSNSMAMRNLTEAGIIEVKDAQEQLVADGLLTISLSPAPGLPEPTTPGNGIVSPTHVVAKELGKPVAPSKGGQGEITAKALSYLDFKRLDRLGQKNRPDFASVESVERSMGVIIPEASKLLKMRDLAPEIAEKAQFYVENLAKESSYVEGLAFKSLSAQVPEDLLKERSELMNTSALQAVCFYAVESGDVEQKYLQLCGRLGVIIDEFTQQIRQDAAEHIQMEA